jgi:hypothetical protein
MAPLQVYSSALVFAPEMSIVRRQFKNQIPHLDTPAAKSAKKLGLFTADARGLLRTRQGRGILAGW